MTSRSEPGRVYRITDADRGLTEDQAGRQRRYLISMGIRTVCFVGAILTSGPLRWVLFSFALLLPYVAVVIANAGRERTRDSGLRVMTSAPPDALGSSAPGSSAPGSSAPGSSAPGSSAPPPGPETATEQGRPPAG
jgi:hypothetical protein